MFFCPCSKRKTAWAISTKVGRHIGLVHSSACIDSEVKRSRSQGCQVRCKQTGVCRSVWLLRFCSLMSGSLAVNWTVCWCARVDPGDGDTSTPSTSPSIARVSLLFHYVASANCPIICNKSWFLKIIPHLQHVATPCTCEMCSRNCYAVEHVYSGIEWNKLPCKIKPLKVG